MGSRLVRFLARVLPWFDQAQYDSDRRKTRRLLEAAERIRLAYLPAGERVNR